MKEIKYSDIYKEYKKSGRFWSFLFQNDCISMTKFKQDPTYKEPEYYICDFTNVKSNNWPGAGTVFKLINDYKTI